MNYLEMLKKMAEEQVFLKQENQNLHQKLSALEEDLINLKSEFEALSELLFADFKYPVDSETKEVISEPQEKSRKPRHWSRKIFYLKNAQGETLTSGVNMADFVTNTFQYIVSSIVKNYGGPVPGDIIRGVLEKFSAERILGPNSKKKIFYYGELGPEITYDYNEKNCIRVNVNGSLWKAYVYTVWDQHHSFKTFREILKEEFPRWEVVTSSRYKNSEGIQ